MHSGQALTDEISSTLLQVARDIIAGGRVHLSFEGTTCHGFVRATGRHRTLGKIISGQEFEAEVVSDTGPMTVNFIMNENLDEWEMEGGTWGSTIPILKGPERDSLLIGKLAPHTMH